MKTKELRSASELELEQALADSMEELYNLRFQQATDRIENPGRMKQIRKDIARIRTVMRERREK
jgi:large subunit ribosomal protein L29